MRGLPETEPRARPGTDVDLIPMPRTDSEQSRLKRVLYRPVWLPTLVTLVLLLVALGLLVGMSRESLEGLRPVQKHLAEVSRLQDVGLHIERLLVAYLADNVPITPADMQELRHEVEELLNLEDTLAPQSAERLREVQQALTNSVDMPRDAVITTLTELRRILLDETAAHARLLEKLKRANEIQLEIATATVIALPLLALVTIFLLRKRILIPLKNLSELMTLLARQDYSTAATGDVDPLLRPLVENYNNLVTRLAQLEQEHETHRQALENQVRAAAKTLLEQQRNLANAERLAAVGELAARLAHELRNPLAGIQLALTNLRREVPDSDHRGRLDLVVKELERVTGLLNGALDQARHAPEPPVEVDLRRSVDELLTLARYQSPPGVTLTEDIADDLSCRLPEQRLRQALLNLILNAAQAYAEDATGQIVVSAERSEERLLLSVCDDGPGFPAEVIEDGLRAFATWRTNGTGLGLTMVERFARDLGGDIQLANRAPHGACVTLNLPCRGQHA